MKKLRSLLIIPMLLILVTSLFLFAAPVSTQVEFDLPESVLAPALEETAPAVVFVQALSPISSLPELIPIDMVVGLSSLTTMLVSAELFASYNKGGKVEYSLSSSPGFIGPFKFPY